MEAVIKLVPFLLVLVIHGNLVLANRLHYIVYMDKSVMPLAFVSHHKWYTSLVDSVRSTSLDNLQDEPRLVYTYHNVVHGYSALLSEDELEALKKSPGFISAYKDKIATMDTTHTPEFLSLSPKSGLWPASNYGEDVIVGMIDTGIWPESPSFSDLGMTRINPSKWKGTCDEAGQEFNYTLCKSKLIGARYFNKGFLAANPNTTIRTNSARDTIGHGTHTSSTVAGNYVEDASFFGYASGTARGIAPRARLAMYKAVWIEEKPYSSDLLAAMDQAVADGVDIISISFGIDSVPLSEDPVAIASFGALEKGVLVSCSAGNAGPSLGKLHNGIPWVMTVAAGSIDRSFAGTLTLGNGLTITGWSLFPAKAVVQDLPLIYSKTISACNSSELLSSVDGIVICDAADAFYNQITSSKPTAPATIFFSDYPIFQSTIFPNPGVVISTKYRQDVINYALNGTKPSATINFQQTILGSKPAPVVAAYSSRGPAPSYPNILKPDVMAPGTLVLAAWPDNVPAATIGGKIRLSSAFNLESGTSMACPHASGVAALLKSAHPEWSPAAIRSAIMTTANNLDNTQSSIKDRGYNFDIASPLAMGAGQVNPNSALDPGLIYDAATQDYINLLCSMNLTHSQISSITSSTSYNCSSPSSDLNYPSFVALYDNRSTEVLTKTFKRTVTNVGDGRATYKAMVIAPKGSKIDVNPQTLTFQEVYDKQSYSITLQYVGDINGTVNFGSLTWIEDGGIHTVRSPIVVSPMITVWPWA